eukprot:scaffold10552_cov276-Chaetoceros_neogracile.AAC.26
MTDPFRDSLDLLAGEDNTPFAEFSIDSDEEEELNRFINEDLEEDDPLGIFDRKKQDPPQGQVVGTEHNSIDGIVDGNEANDDSEATSVTTPDHQSLVDHDVPPVSVPLPAPRVNSNGIDNAGGNGNSATATPSASASENSMEKSTSGSSSSSTFASASPSASASALKKQTVTAMEDPLSSPWTNPVPAATNITNDSHIPNSATLPYPNITHTMTPMPTDIPPHMGMGANYNTADLSSSASAGMASFVSKTQSITSTFSSFASKFQDSSFASKFQDAVSSAAINASGNAKPMNQNHSMSGMGASMQSNMPLNASRDGYAPVHAHGHAHTQHQHQHQHQQQQQSMYGMNSGVGAMAIGNGGVGMHGNPATGNAPNGAVYGAQNGINGNGNGNMNRGPMPAKISNRDQDLDKVKRE